MPRPSLVSAVAGVLLLASTASHAARLDASAMVPGQPLTLTVRGAPAGAQVYLFVSLRGPGAGPCAPSGAPCLDVRRPSVLGHGPANAQGVAQLTVTVPAALRDPEAWFQAVVLSAAPETTDVVSRVVGDGDLDGSAPPFDCDDTDPAIGPHARDVPNGVDDDCSGAIDDPVWTYTRVSFGDGRMPEAHLDDAGQLRVTWAIQYQYFSVLGPSGWTTETAVSRIRSDGSGITVDGDGDVHVVAPDDVLGEVHHATRIGGVWSTEILDPNYDNGSLGTPQTVAVVLDDLDLVHALWFDVRTGIHLYREDGLGGWQTFLLPATSVGSVDAVWDDVHGGIAIAYQEVDDARFAFFDGASFATVPITTTGSTGAFIHLGIDDAGVPHVAYLDHDTDIVHAWVDAGQWTSEVVRTGAAIRDVDIAVQGDGSLHIAWPEDSALFPDAIRYAYRPAGGTVWYDQQIDDPNDGVYHTGELDMVVGDDGVPHVFYHELNYPSDWGNLVHATWR